jgi:chromosome segregation ATPase
MTGLFQEAPSDLLKQLEAKLQTLIQQRNQLREELERVQKESGSHGDELRQLQERVHELTQEKEVLAQERKDMLRQVESILEQLEKMG